MGRACGVVDGTRDGPNVAGSLLAGNPRTNRGMEMSKKDDKSNTSAPLSFEITQLNIELVKLCSNQ